MTPPNDTSVCRSAAAEAWTEVLVASVPASLRAGSLSLAAGWMLASAGLQEVDFGDSHEERTFVEIEITEKVHTYVQPGEGPSRGLFCDCITSIFAKVRLKLYFPPVSLS